MSFRNGMTLQQITQLPLHTLVGRQRRQVFGSLGLASLLESENGLLLVEKLARDHHVNLAAVSPAEVGRLQ